MTSILTSLRLGVSRKGPGRMSAFALSDPPRPLWHNYLSCHPFSNFLTTQGHVAFCSGKEWAVSGIFYAESSGSKIWLDKDRSSLQLQLELQIQLTLAQRNYLAIALSHWCACLVCVMFLVKSLKDQMTLGMFFERSSWQTKYDTKCFNMIRLLWVGWEL